jgi:DNA helicase HerA-like ATPase
MDVSEVRLKEHVGIVTSDTTTGRFSFFVTALKNKVEVAEEDFVIINHPVLGDACPLLAVVKEIRNYEEVVGTTLSEKSVRTVAVGEVVGFVDLRDPEARRLHRLSDPPNPGSKVYLPYFEFLEDTFSRDAEGKRFGHALHLGSVDSRAVNRNGDARLLDFYQDVGDFGRQHFLIAGLSGAGKTYTAGVIVEELANKTDLPVVILDPYGEYASIGVRGDRFKKLVEDSSVSAKDYSFEFEVSVYARDPEAMKSRLEGYGVLAGKNARYSIKSFSSRLREGPDEKAVHAVGDELRDAVKPRHVLVLDGKGLGFEERRKLFTGCVDALWSYRADESVEPFVLVVEEAEDIETEMLERVASEGRKFGVSVCLLSQHPSEISRRVLSQIGCHLMGRMTDTEDLDRLRTVAGEKSALLPNLRTGEWIVNGGAIRRPVKVSVRDRYSLST